MHEATPTNRGFSMRKPLAWTAVLAGFSAAFLEAESGVVSFAFFCLWVLAFADCLVGLPGIRLWLAALGICSAAFTAVESVPAALGLIAFWVFLVASSLLGFRWVLLWLGVLAVYSGIFAVFEPDRDAVLCFCLLIPLVAIVRTVARPRVLAILCSIGGAVIWPASYFAGGFTDPAYISRTILLVGVLLGGTLGFGLFAAAEVGRLVVSWADQRLRRRDGGKRREGRRLQFSMAKMFCAIVLLSLPLGWIAAQIQEGRRNRDAEAWLEAQGIGVNSYSRNWLKSLLRVRPIRGVSVFPKREFGDDDLAGVVAHVKELSSFRSLNLSQSSISDAGLGQLVGLDRLESLELSSTEGTDAGLRHLRGAVRLERIDLTETRIGDGGLEHLAGLRSLRDLDLSHTAITDEGLGGLEKMTGLRSLVLAGNEVGDPGIAHLRGLNDLWELNLYGTNVTDAGLEVLQGLNRLRRVDLRGGTPVTVDGVAKLRKALPDCRVEYSPVAVRP